MSELYKYEAHYHKKEWSRGGAWFNLLSQQIPGCPKPLIVKDDGQREPDGRLFRPRGYSWGEGS